MKNIMLHKLPTKNIISTVIVFMILGNSQSLSADPKPGDVFREYHFADGKGIHLCHKGAVHDSVAFTMSIDDLRGAIKAEISGYFHTGHVGTSERRIQFNGGQEIDIPAAEIPADNKECYFTYIFGRPSVEVSLKDLKEGTNNIIFSVGPQLCHGFNWPCYGFHCLTLRVYYDKNKNHPTGEIQYPLNGQIITNDELMIKTFTHADSAKTAIASVDVIGYYYDYPFEGSGKYLDWHYLIDEYGRWFGFINRNTNSPYHETWNLEWLPDQDEPIKLMARVTDVSGMSYMTAAVENITLKRENHSVKMYKTIDVPENFKVRVDETMKSHFEAIGNVTQITDVSMASIIPIGHMDSKSLTFCGINGTKIKQYEGLPNVHGDFFYESYIPVSPSLITKGVNEFFVHSNTEGHMTEVCWPGPALLVRYNRSPEKK